MYVRCLSFSYYTVGPLEAHVLRPYGPLCTPLHLIPFTIGFVLTCKKITVFRAVSAYLLYPCF